MISFQARNQIIAMHWILSPEPIVEGNGVPVVADILSGQDYISAEFPKAWLKQKLVLSPQRIIEIANLTVGQRSNPLWGMSRNLRLTASNFGIILDAIRKNRVTLSCKKRLMSAYNLEKISPIIWGITHEQEALDVYRSYGAEVQETGIWIHQSGVLGASPDGLVQKSPHIVPHFQTPESQLLSPDIVEVKCPYSAREGSVSAAISRNKTFFLEDNSGALALKTTHDYYHQIQGQLYLTNTFCADLVVWTPVDTQVIRITKDVAWETNIQKMIDFYFDRFLDLAE